MSNLPNLIIVFVVIEMMWLQKLRLCPPWNTWNMFFLFFGEPGNLGNPESSRIEFVLSHIVFTLLELGLVVQKGDIYWKKHHHWIGPFGLRVFWDLWGSFAVPFYADLLCQKLWLVNLPPALTYRPRNKALFRAHKPLVSHNKALLNPFFRGGTLRGG